MSQHLVEAIEELAQENAALRKRLEAATAEVLAEQRLRRAAERMAEPKPIRWTSDILPPEKCLAKIHDGSLGRIILTSYITEETMEATRGYAKEAIDRDMPWQIAQEIAKRLPVMWDHDRRERVHRAILHLWVGGVTK